MSQRNRVIELYKTVSTSIYSITIILNIEYSYQLFFKLQYLGKEYKYPEKFRTTCHKVFLNNSKEQDVQKIDEMIAKGEYVQKEIETLYNLKKYRAMKKRYYD